MRFSLLARIFLILTIILIITYFYWISINFQNADPQASNKEDSISSRNVQIKSHIPTVAVVACGDRLQETLVMLKSAIMLSKVKLRFIIITEDELIQNFNEKLSEWEEYTNNGFTFRVMPLTFPDENAEEWRKLFKPCASQRLFLPSVLSDVDSILYVDTDTLFLTSVEDVWSYFDKMNSSQMAALAPEHEDATVGWYNRFARHPYYGKLGVNSGVMLMNLTKMREFKWVDYVIPIYKRYKLQITWGDQDIINIIFHFNPDKLYIYSCRYNFRPDHCMYMSVCKPAEKLGVAVLHGSRGFFHSQKQPAFSAIYKAFEEFRISSDIYQDFYQPLETFLDLSVQSNCGRLSEAYLKNLRKFIDIKEDNR